MPWMSGTASCIRGWRRTRASFRWRVATRAAWIAPSIPEPVGALVADVSFISLTKALPAALALTAPGAWLVALIKPQFEAGRAAVGKGGIVRDPGARHGPLRP